MKRVLLPCLAITLSLALPAFVHETTEFDACATTQRGVQECRDRIAVFQGPVYIDASVLPRHAGARGWVRIWIPDTHDWDRAGVAVVHEHGFVRWRWEPEYPADIEDRAYRFRFVLPGHGRSDVVKVFVVRPPV